MWIPTSSVAALFRPGSSVSGLGLSSHSDTAVPGSSNRPRFPSGTRFGSPRKRENTSLI